MKVLVTGVLTGLVVLVSVSQSVFGAIGKSEGSNQIKVYKVDKKVSEFPEGEDFSTPEAAYATINRLNASGEQEFWPRVSISKLEKQLPAKKDKQEVPKADVYEWLNENIVEVRIFQGKYAGVITKIAPAWKKRFNYRSFELEDGKWLNAGNSGFKSLEKARKHFDKMCGIYAKRTKRLKIDNPEAYLKPFVEFLKTSGQQPKVFVMRALAKYKVTIIGEIHHRPRYWAFNSSLVAEPDFTNHIGTIYMELPSNDQKLIDKFLAGEECDRMLVIEMLRNMLWMGWPDQPMLDFFIAVWKVNQNLHANQKLRIVLVDMERPWQKIQKKEDWKLYDLDRDKYMAENIINDMENNPREKRNGLFIVGIAHTALHFRFYGGHPHKTAGWYLNEKLGEDRVYAIMQHRCVKTNWGRVDGRLCLGLFDSVFESFENRPVAFTLENGPFGEQFYDGQPDTRVWSKYRDGFKGYLYLGPLEDEIFSPLISGFYTDDFFEEIERRYRLMYGKDWAESYGIKESNAESFISWMSGKGGSWGRPRKWRNRLGPMDAWKYGDDWEKEIQEKKHKDALKNPQVIKAAARKLFDAIRDADYEYHYGGKHHDVFLPEDMDYEVHHHFDSWVEWICKNFKDNPIETVETGEVCKSNNGLPAISYAVRLRDGRELRGNLPFRYMPKNGYWKGIQGIDWHLQDSDATKPEPVKQIVIPPPSSVDRSTPEATVKSWTKAVATGNIKDAMACMLPNGADYADVKKILSSSQGSPYQKIWGAIDPDKPIRILGKQLIEDEASIGWEFYFKEDFTVKGRTFKRGDGFEFEATLKKHGDCWLIDSI